MYNYCDYGESGAFVVSRFLVARLCAMPSAGVGLMGLVTAAKKYIHHPTYGNAARALLAALNLAEDLG